METGTEKEAGEKTKLKPFVVTALAMRLYIAIAVMMILEVFLTIATAHQHHSEAKWEISAAYFGTAFGYVLVRLVIWLPLACVLLLLAKLRYRFLAILQLAVTGITLEVATTLVSILFRDKAPPYGIFYGSFSRYLIGRAVFWVPLAFAMLLVLARTTWNGPVTPIRSWPSLAGFVKLIIAKRSH